MRGFASAVDYAPLASDCFEFMISPRSTVRRRPRLMRFPPILSSIAGCWYTASYRRGDQEARLALGDSICVKPAMSRPTEPASAGAGLPRLRARRRDLMIAFAARGLRLPIKYFPDGRLVQSTAVRLSASAGPRRPAPGASTLCHRQSAVPGDARFSATVMPILTTAA